MPTLEVCLLGTLEMRSDGQTLPKPPTLKSQSLLAYLLLHRQQPQPRERLAGLFWGDRPERKARRSLTTALWHIRRALPEAAILLAGSQTVQFDPHADLWLDADEFEALAGEQDLAGLQSAATLYRGTLLDGFYDDWVLTSRYRLEMLFADVLTRLMALQATAGEQQAALTTAQRLLDQDPLREDAHRLAMRAFCCLGQRGAALEQYRRCQEAVKRELNAGPMVETTELYQAILEGRIEIGSPEQAMPVPAVAGPPSRAPGFDPLEATAVPPLVGREQEMAFLQDRYAQGGQSGGGLVLVSGEAGVGKTRLAGELAERLRWQGDCVLSGRCYEFERFLLYQPIAEALNGVVPAMTGAELEAHPAWILAEVARLAPELLEKVPGLRAAPALRSEEGRLRLFEGLFRFLAQLSRQKPLLLVLEDLHWATESTLQLVHYLVRHLASHPVLLLGTFRPEAVGRRHPLRALRQDLEREGLLASLRLEPLSRPAVKALVAEMSGAGAAAVPLARRLYAETEGNPFFLMELVRTLFDRGRLVLDGGRWQGDFAQIAEADLPLPRGVSETILARVHWLDETAQQVLRLAAVLGREFDFELVAALWERGEEATMEAVDVLLRRRLIEEGTGAAGRDYAFSHHKIQEVIYAEVPERQRQRAHGRAGLAMERLHGPQPGDLAGELAFHFQEGARHDEALQDKAIEYLLRAGDSARLAQAHREAVAYYQQALALLRQQRQHGKAARALMKLGLTYHGSRDYERARAAYDEGFALWQRAVQHEAARPVPAPQTLQAWQLEPVTLDPGEVSDWHSGVVLEQLFACLIRFGPDMEVLPETARSWEVLDGGRTYLFHLRQDGRWSDGTPVTAQDFAYACKRFLHPARPPSPAMSFYNVRGARDYHQGVVTDPDSVAVRAPDEFTLVVDLEVPDRNFLHLSLYAIPVPRHLVEVHGDAWTEPGRMLSNGPFALASWERAQSMTLVRNPHYHGHYEGNVERVELSFAPPTAAIGAYEAGCLDILALDYVPVAEMDRLRHQHPEEYMSVPDLSTYFLRFDLSRPPFHDCRVRRAFALATDKRRLADLVVGGHVFPATGGQVPPAVAGHAPGIGLAYDPDTARRLLSEAGYPDGRGFPGVEFLMGSGRGEVVEDLVAQWSTDLGVQVTGKTVDWAGLLNRAQHEPPHIVGIASAAHYPDPATFVGPVRRDEEHPAYVWQHAGYDRLAERFMQATDPTERLKLVQRMDRTVVGEAWLVPLWYGRRHLLVKPWVVRLPTSPIMGCFWKDIVVAPHRGS